MSIPFTDAHRQQLQDDAQAFLTEFGKEYLKGFGGAMFERIAAESEGGEADAKKLSYRDWDSVERPELFSGFCFMKAGEGAGSFSKWKKVFLAERQDYNIDVFKTDKDFQANKKPTRTILTCGLNLEHNPDSHYRREIRILSSGMGLGEDGLSIAFSPWSWALTHPVRTNFVFQLHAGKDPSCSCLGGGAAVEPEDVGSENEKDRKDWIEFMDRCVNKAQARDVSQVTGLAFDKSVEKLKVAFPRISNLNDNGTEQQMLIAMLVEHCLTPIRDEVLGGITGPAAMKTAIWYKTRGVIVGVLEKLVDPAWSATKSAAQAAGEKIEPTIKQGLGPIFKAKNTIKEKVSSSVSDKVGSALGKMVTPFLKPIFTAFEKPLEEGFQSAKDVYSAKVSEAITRGLPSDAKQANLILDEIPRTGTNVYDVYHHCWELVDPLKKLVELSSEVFGGLDPSALRTQAQDLILQTLDAAVYTLELQIEAQGVDSAESLKNSILQDFDHDVVIQKSTFMKEVMRSLLIAPLMKELDPVTSPIIEGFNSLVPEEMAEFLNVAGVFDEVIDLLVGGPIDNIVDAAYPTPSKQQQQQQTEVEPADPPELTTEM